MQSTEQSKDLVTSGGHDHYCHYVVIFTIIPIAGSQEELSWQDQWPDPAEKFGFSPGKKLNGFSAVK